MKIYSQDYNHDKSGNLRSDGTLLYFWDAFNRLKYIERISDNMGMGEFLYDAQNRRVFHTAPFQDAPTYGNARRYVYMGPQLIAEYFKPSGAAEHLLEQYAYGVYLDEVWARQKMIPNVIGGYNSEYLLFHHDPLYSVSGVTDPWGNLLEAYEYDPYGRRIVITDGPDPDSIVNFTSDDIRGTASPLHVKHAFTGQIYDEESGLYYYKERYFHPGLGRFINRDPIGRVLPYLQILNINEGSNLYQYVRSNPYSYSDPYGLSSCKCGPDATASINAVLARMRADFTTWSWWTKRKKCASLYNILPIPGLGTAMSSWDIYPVPSSYGCATGECNETVMIYDGCHNFWGVNYVLFGAMNKLCRYPKSHMLQFVNTYTLLPGKTTNRLSKIAWAKAGYNGWPSSKTPNPPRKYRNCKPCNMKYTSPLRYLWQPERTGNHHYQPIER
jgi:RHS repeat-associated protein